MSVGVTSFSNDDSVSSNATKNSAHLRHFIDLVHKFQNSYFKEHPWKAAKGFYKKHIV